MKFNSYLNEATGTELIIKDCDEYLKDISPCNGNLYRGVKKVVRTWTRVVPRTDRKPRDTKEYIQDKFNEKFQKKFGWKPRSEGVMVIPKSIVAAGYASDGRGPGSVCLFYPADGFKFIWSPKVPDFFLMVKNLWPREGEAHKHPPLLPILERFRLEMNAVLTMLDKKAHQKYILQTDNTDEISDIVADAIVDTYTDKDLCKAIHSHDNEIIFKCSHYYLVNSSWAYDNGIRIYRGKGG